MALLVKIFAVLAVVVALSSGESQLEDELMESWCCQVISPALNQMIADVLGPSGRQGDVDEDEDIIWPDHPNCTDETLEDKIEEFLDRTEKIFTSTPIYTEMCSGFELDKHFYGAFVEWLDPVGVMIPGHLVCTQVGDPQHYRKLGRVDSGFTEEIYNYFYVSEEKFPTTYPPKPQVSSEYQNQQTSSEHDQEHVQHQNNDQYLHLDHFEAEELKNEVQNILETSNPGEIKFMVQQLHSLLQQERFKRENEMKTQQEKHDKEWEQLHVKYEKIVEDLTYDRDHILAELNAAIDSQLDLESLAIASSEEKVDELETTQQKHYAQILHEQQEQYEKVLKKKTEEQIEVMQQLKQYEEYIQKRHQQDEDVLLAQEQTDVALEELKKELHDTVADIDSELDLLRNDQHDKSLHLFQDMCEDYLHTQQTLSQEILEKEKKYVNNLLEKHLLQNRILLKQVRQLNNTIAFVRDQSANTSQHLQDQQRQEANCSLALQIQQDWNANVLLRVEAVETILKALLNKQEIESLKTTQQTSRLEKIEQRQKEQQEKVLRRLDEQEKVFQWQQQEQEKILQRQQEEQFHHVFHLAKKNEKRLLDGQDLFENLLLILNLTHGDLLQGFWQPGEDSPK